jgi:glycosyltransferase involved in cell wall biosynthesis
MKILMLTPNVPWPPNSGGRMRMWEQIRYLGTRHDLTVVSCAFPGDENVPRRPLGESCARVLIAPHQEGAVEPADRSLPWPLYPYASTVVRDTLAPLRKEHFDLLFVSNLFMAPHRALFPVPAVLDEYNSESDLVRQSAELCGTAPGDRERTFLRATWLHLAQYEDHIWPSFPLRFMVSEKDLQEISRRCSTGRTVVVENGIDASGTRYDPPAQSRTVLFMGTLEYGPNVDAVLHFVSAILPLVRRRVPEVRLIVAGRHPAEEVRDAATAPGVELIANPEEMGPIARRCALAVAPVRIGGGTRIKILHAMAMGLPVVSTTLGCEGLAVRDGLHLIVRDGPRAFADAVVALMGDPARAERLARSARALVEERYDWQPILKRMEDELISLVK